jgi:hypothetical protein
MSYNKGVGRDVAARGSEMSQKPLTGFWLYGALASKCGPIFPK